MNIKAIATKLRRAADVLEELLHGEISLANETSKVATKIRKSFKKATKRKNGGRKNGKAHWTQTARGRKIMAANARKRRGAKVNAAAGGQ